MQMIQGEESLQPIGGEFELKPEDFRFQGSADEAPFASGRFAYRAILRRARGDGFTSILLPDYLCESVVAATIQEGFRIERYPIGPGLIPAGDLNDRVSGSLVLVVDYFGMTDIGSTCTRLRDAGASVIADLVQSPFGMKPEAADYAFGGYRKYLSVPEGAYALAGTALLVPDGHVSEAGGIKTCGGLMKTLARTGGGLDAAYLDIFAKGEACLDGEKGIVASGFPLGALRSRENDDSICRRRRENYAHLARAIEECGLHPLISGSSDSVPLAMPVVIKRRDLVRKLLIDQRIYLPVHWQSLPARGYCGFLHEHELSLVVDQRYGPADMDRIADALARVGAREAHHDR